MTTTKSVTPTANVEPAAAKVEPVPNKVEPAAVKVEPLASGRPAETSDQHIARAKTTIAARLDDPRSAEFGEMKRAMRKNMLEKAVDTIRGYVKGKKVSGESTGDTPFLYLVKDDEAYVVDGPATSIAATAYRNIRNWPASRTQRLIELRREAIFFVQLSSWPVSGLGLFANVE
jgi:hypothetical protein